MNCRDLQEGGLLDALAPARPGDTRWSGPSDELREAAREHVAQCAACQGALETLRRLRAEAAALPAAIDPPRDLWPGIAARLEGERTARRPPSRRRRIIGAAALTAAAAGLAALVVAPAWRGTSAPGFGAATDTAALVSLRATNVGYAEAERELWAAYEARRDRLQPQTQAEIEKNLRVVDEALANIRAALERDPGSVAHREEYVRVERRRLELLRAAATIPHFGLREERP